MRILAAVGAHKAFSLLQVAGCIAMGLAVSSCVPIGSTAVYTDLAVEVSGRDETGKPWRAKPEELVVVAAHPQSTNPFPHVRYNGPLFVWTFGAEGTGLGNDIRPVISSPICFRFDQAFMSSNMHVEEVPMRIKFAYHHSLPAELRRNTSAVDGGKSQPAVSICFKQNEPPWAFGLSLDLTSIFPSQRLFNMKLRGDSPDLLERGIGNWLRIRVPYEYDGKREEMEVKFTLRDSTALTKYSTF